MMNLLAMFRPSNKRFNLKNGNLMCLESDFTSALTGCGLWLQVQTEKYDRAVKGCGSVASAL